MEDEVSGNVARMGGMRNAYKILVGQLEGKRPLGRPRGRGKDNISMYLRKCGGKVWPDACGLGAG